MKKKMDYIKDNLKFWNKVNIVDDSKGYLLFEAFYKIPHQTYGISKISLIIAKISGLKPYLIVPHNGNVIAESMCSNRFYFKSSIFGLLLKNSSWLVRLFIKCDNRNELLNLKIDNYEIGACLYDLLLRVYGKPTIESFTMYQRFRLVFEVLYFLFFRQIVENNPIKMVVLGDSAYRHGLLYELCKKKEICCITPISLNALFMIKYSTIHDFEHSFITNELIEDICKNIDYNSLLEKYYIKRMSGNEMQHDVLCAYKDKVITEYNSFYDKYKLKMESKTVVIMAHIFSDAPHSYDNMLYEDYWEWFVATLNVLLKNANVNVLVKEHPSSVLYNECGIIMSYLKSINKEYLLLDNSESTVSVLNNADIVVTAGGTIGLEFASKGKPVVLASYPPYSRLGFTNEFETKEKYECFLLNEIHTLDNLTDLQKDIAIKVACVSFCNNNFDDSFEIAHQTILLGKTTYKDNLGENLKVYNKVNLEDQNIYKYLKAFLNFKHRIFLSGNIANCK